MRYGLIGERLGHSYSKEIHAKIADYKYELVELKPDELEKFMERREFSAINVTIPYKQAVMPLIDFVSDEAKRIGAVNTVVNRGGRLYGYNTDFAGMTALLRRIGIELRGKKVLIAGAGGTAATARTVAEYSGARAVLNVSRRESAAPSTVTYSEAAELHSDAQVIINTTPVGMFPFNDGTSIDLAAYPALEGVADAIYNPLRTNFVQDAAARNIPSGGGLYMLAAQAVYASALFTDREVDPDVAERAYSAVLHEKMNIILIGMPTSGKTQVGLAIAKKLGRTFIDTDEVILSRIGCSIADYFAEHGEASFRQLESKVVAEISPKTGVVIATGGGAALDCANVKRLHQNGRLMFLDRPLEKLTARRDRPLAADIESLRALYDRRYPIYKAAADITVDGSGTVDEAAELAIKEFER